MATKRERVTDYANARAAKDGRVFECRIDTCREWLGYPAEHLQATHGIEPTAQNILDGFVLIRGSLHKAIAERRIKDYEDVPLPFEGTA